MSALPFQLHLGDCLEVLDKIPDCSIDAIVTDPPYGLSDHKPAMVLECLKAWTEGKPFVPKGKGFMGKSWDAWVPGPEVWKECLRVLKPGGHILAFAGTRSMDLMAMAIRLAGFELRDSIGYAHDNGGAPLLAWCYGCLSEDSEVLTERGWQLGVKVEPSVKILAYDLKTGGGQWEVPSAWHQYHVEVGDAFHIRSAETDQIVSWGHRCLVDRGKGLEVVVAEDLQEREKFPVYVGRGRMELTTAQVTRILYRGRFWCPTVSTGAFVARRYGKEFITGNSGFPKNHNVSKAIAKAREGNTDAAKQWSGWGTALKPAWEPILMARRPLENSVVENVLRYGTGGINVDKCRVDHSPEQNATPQEGASNSDALDGTQNPLGRWPANVLHDGSEKVLETFPNALGSIAPISGHEPTAHGFSGNVYGAPGTQGRLPIDRRDGGGSAARFFYCAKASKADRDEGLEEFASGKVNDGRKVDADNAYQRGKTERKNKHPTVKPTALMRYLCRLVTPPGGTVLDPFTGSGSTGKAAILEGFNFVGIELNEEYFPIARARIEHALQVPHFLRHTVGAQTEEDSDEEDPHDSPEGHSDESSSEEVDPIEHGRLF